MAAVAARTSTIMTDGHGCPPGFRNHANFNQERNSIVQKTENIKPNQSANTKLEMKDQNMKAKTKFILKSLADLPANTLALAASVPQRAMQMTKHLMTQPVQATRRKVRAARQRSGQFINDLSARANVPLKQRIPWSEGWPHGGLNE